MFPCINVTGPQATCLLGVRQRVIPLNLPRHLRDSKFLNPSFHRSSEPSSPCRNHSTLIGRCNAVASHSNLVVGASWCSYKRLTAEQCYGFLDTRECPIRRGIRDGSTDLLDPPHPLLLLQTLHAGRFRQERIKSLVAPTKRTSAGSEKLGNEREGDPCSCLPFPGNSSSFRSPSFVASFGAHTRGSVGKGAAAL